jgi:hypothetical protein
MNVSEEKVGVDPIKANVLPRRGNVHLLGCRVHLKPASVDLIKEKLLLKKMNVGLQGRKVWFRKEKV